MVLTTEIGMIIGRSIIAIFALFLVTKILGYKQLSQLTIYDYVIGITIGSIAADTITSLDEKMINGIIAIMAFGIFGYGLSYMAIKSSTANTFLNGKPIILMKNGKFNLENLKSTKISISKFIEESRLKGFYDINVINYAILETNGQISFLPKEEYQNANSIDLKSDEKNKKSKQTMCSPLIIDGEIITDTLNEYQKDEKWLKNELKKMKISDNDKILLATIDEKKNIKLYKD